MKYNLRFFIWNSITKEGEHIATVDTCDCPSNGQLVYFSDGLIDSKRGGKDIEPGTVFKIIRMLRVYEPSTGEDNKDSLSSIEICVVSSNE
jgi:hypothetical protein